MSAEHVVVDASALVDLLVSASRRPLIDARLAGCVLHAPAVLDAEVLSALGRLHRAGALEASRVRRHLAIVADAPIERHALSPLLEGAWRRRDRLRLADALYVELAERLDVSLLTTDARLGRAVRRAQVIGP